MNTILGVFLSILFVTIGAILFFNGYTFIGLGCVGLTMFIPTEEERVK